MTLISQITLAAAAMIDLSAMLMVDTQAIQHNGHNNSRYYAWLRENSELTSTKRILVLAVLIGCCSTMAQSSWIVVLVLAAVLIIQGIMLWANGGIRHTKLNGKSWCAYAIGMILAAAFTGAAGYVGSSQSAATGWQSAAMAAVMTLAVSPLLAMLTAWLLSPFIKKGENTVKGSK